MEEEAKQHMRRGSLISMSVLIAFALLGWLAVQHFGAAPEGSALAAKVTQDGAVVATLPLSENARQTFTCDEGVNTVVVQDGAVHIEDADCKGGDCMKQGTIDSTGRLLVCLPHKLIVEVVPLEGEGASAPSVYTGEELVGSSTAPDIDAIAK